ncbi:glycoside hydrolase family 99-like domain-containing protein [Aestuariivita sp.]|uniref:glycoside hydrolase family 99-like domain-containing protein n=1 Tax=Aestuariivita sp. TaxID=1872407 RepID=UPI0025BE478B|nr:glycoside hydrolase family 99-like domain-containing protein [Aestuariivita sp.]
MTKLKKALQVLLLSPSKLLYIRRMKKSGLFDRQFYLSANPLIHKVFHYMPERHFALMGEQAGLYPNPDFSPHAYLRHNADVAASGMAPFDHFLRIGRHEDRLTKDLPGDWTENTVSVPALRDPAVAQAAYAIVIHMYYHDLWDQFRAKLESLDIDFDLYVTITERKGEDADGLAARIAEEYPRARVVVMPNHGRDIFPFVHLVNAGWLDGYDAVCKFHTKKSPHRQDGDRWRQHLIDGILPGPGTRDLVARFAADHEAAFWVADGQHYNDTQWWGSNFTMVAQLLHRIELTPDEDHLSFPAGSIYWLKPRVIDMIRGLQLRPDNFEPERGQTDGTLAHAMERALGMLAEAGGMKILQTTQLKEAKPAPALPRPGLVSAFYLPQFHPVPENDAWWGPGFTEWTSVTRAEAQFGGHVQPMLPADLGFYDLRVTDVMGQQAALAKGAGIDAFCVYHYWFDGKRILETPIDQLMTRPEIDFPFYLCWANESWRRNWDGLSGEVLMPQSYAPGFATELAHSLVPYFNDPRYQRPDGTRPRFVIYRPEDMPDPATAISEMRDAWRDAGVGEVELGAVLFHIEGESPVPADLFDFWVEMPPHGLVGSDDYLFGGPEGDVMQAGVSPSFSGLIYDYDTVRQTSLSQYYARSLPRHTIAGIMPCWDNTARRGRKAHIAYGANPARFDHWLRGMLARRVPASYRNELFINAWNEWAEKAMLEPSEQYRSAYLSVLRTYL